jgi:hypothetical protein
MASSQPRIGPQQLELARRDGPAALAWQRRAGLAEARSRCVAMVIAGLAPFFGWLWLDWSPLTMLMLLAVDVVAVLAGDLLKLLLAGRAVSRTHGEDHRAQHVLNIVGGLTDGSGTYTQSGSGVSPWLLFGMALAFAALAITAALVAAIEALGIPLSSVPAETGFLWLAGASLVLHVGGAMLASLRSWLPAAAPTALYLDSGGVIGLGAGLLVLVWLPLGFGAFGTILLLVVLFLFRLGFGLFALYYIPKVTRDLERFLRDPSAFPVPPPRPRRRQPA